MPEKGPPVFLDYDQASLDAAYNQAAYAPNREQLIKRRINDSELARLQVGEPERLAYGQAEIERLDIYRTKRDAAPVFVFIHGGAWRSGRSQDFATPARTAPARPPNFSARTANLRLQSKPPVRRCGCWSATAETCQADRNRPP